MVKEEPESEGGDHITGGPAECLSDQPAPAAPLWQPAAFGRPLELGAGLSVTRPTGNSRSLLRLVEFNARRHGAMSEAPTAQSRPGYAELPEMRLVGDGPRDDSCSEWIADRRASILFRLTVSTSSNRPQSSARISLTSSSRVFI